MILVTGIYYFTRIKPPSVPRNEPGNVKATGNPVPEEEVHARDAAYWGVTEPDFEKIILEQQKRWVGDNSDSYVTQQERTDYRLVEAPRSPLSAGKYEKVYTPEISGVCEGRVDDVILLDYKFFRVDDEIFASVNVEGDLYRGRADRAAPKCLPPERIGRRFVETRLVWKPASRQWADSRLDPEHLEKARQKARERELAEEEKFKQEQREIEARRARTREVLRLRREANRADRATP